MSLTLLIILTSLNSYLSSESHDLPVIDISPLLSSSSSAHRSDTITTIGNACRQHGFFYIMNHGIDTRLQSDLEQLSHEFFALSDEEKRAIHMSGMGKAWRGSFLCGEEMTSNIADQKEGIYFGKELRSNDTRPLHGANVWPSGPLGERMKPAVLTYMDEMQRLASVLMDAIISSLNVPSDVFGDQFSDPTTLFRIFHYPPHNESFGPNSQAVGEHTDYGYLTILKQDDSGGLQVKTHRDGLKEAVWMDVPPIPDTFVVNLGDALQHNTGGLLLATPHRVAQRRDATAGRLSFPFFFDPSFEAKMVSVVKHLSVEDQKRAETNRKRWVAGRWDNMDPVLYTGTYGDYLINKVSKVFPQFSDYLKQNNTCVENSTSTTSSK